MTTDPDLGICRSCGRGHRAHRALGAGVTQADAEAIAVHLFDNGPDS